MSPEQIERIVHALERLASRGQTYTITGAADWPILAAIGGILIMIIAFMWRDLRGTIRDNRLDWKESMAMIRSEWQDALREHKAEGKKENDILWGAMRDCQSDCCPPRVKK